MQLVGPIVASLALGMAGFIGAYFAWSQSLWVAVVACGIQSFAIAHSLGLVSIIIQEDVPDELRGRVMSIYTLLFLGSTPIGSMIVGTLAEKQGVRMAIAEMATVCALGVIAGLIYASRVRGQLAAGDEAAETGAPAPAA